MKKLSIYFTAGYPAVDDTVEIAQTLQSCGADMLEIGIPFSDPMADGPTLQASNAAALENGMTLNLLFEQLESLMPTLEIPVYLMGYFNSILNYGVDQFCAKANKLGVTGVIFPDLPLEVFEQQYQGTFAKYGIKVVFLVTPQTSEARIRKIDDLATGFVYAVTSSSTTGNQQKNDASVYLKGLQSMNLKNEIIAGFNIKDAASFKRATEYTDGGIIGSAFVKVLGAEGDLKNNIQQFIQSVKA